MDPRGMRGTRDYEGGEGSFAVDGMGETGA